MKNLRPFLLKNQFLALFLIGASFFLSACSHQEETAIKPISAIPSYVLPSAPGSFNSGIIHNAGCLYIMTHYDTNHYLGYPHKMSIQGVDSVFALFAADSLSAPPGALTSAELQAIDTAFDSTLSQITAPSHSQLQIILDSLESKGIIASDEEGFISSADSSLRLCISWSHASSTLSSLQTTFNATTWTPSSSSGSLAGMYMSVADSSYSLWGPGGPGSGGWGGKPPVAAIPLVGDAAGFVVGAGAEFLIEWFTGTCCNWLKIAGAGLAGAIAASFGISSGVLGGS